MNLRPFGATGMHVSEIGLGGWQLANPSWNSDDAQEGVRIVAQALDSGCTFIDTAPGYGGGASEELIGRALGSARQNVVICTKYGHTPEGSSNYDTSAIRPSLEGSLRRLQTDYIDILLIHNPPHALLDGRTASQYEELETLKGEGKLREYGVSLDRQADLETVISTTTSNAIEVLYNVFHQEPRGAFPMAQTRGAGLIVKVPLDSGWLSGRYRDSSRFTDVRKRWSPEVIARRATLIEQFAALVPPGTSLTHAALQYVLAQPAVSTVIPGAKTAAQARDNFAAATNRLPATVVRAIDALWERELHDEPLPW